uniref:Histone-lysine N-methyltransferase n=1 Tax=Anopheles epiroticus TaxID=199890 RepID=A0A182PST2_9DIPT
ASTSNETNLLTPTTTQKRVKSQERTPEGQKIIKEKPLSTDDMGESGKENEQSDRTQKLSTAENNNSVLRTPSRYLLKQLTSSLSPKMTEISIDTDRRVSRYGRHQKQKDNSDYVPVDLMRYVGNTPVKYKSKMETVDIRQIDKQLENTPNSTGAIHVADPNDISPSITAVALPMINEPIMFPTRRNEHTNLLSMEEIKIVGMDECGDTDKVKAADGFVHNLFERKRSSDADSAKGSSIDLDFLYTAGSVYWGAQSRKSIHWPCIVRVDPETDQITRLHGDKFLEIHVSFFGDRGRRGWIKEHCILAFEGVDVYCTKAKNLEYGKHVKQLLRSEMPKRWKNACSIAEKYIALPLDERLKQFDAEVQLESARFKISRHRMAHAGKNKLVEEEALLVHSAKLESHKTLEQWTKRDRSSSPESPAYEILHDFSSPGQKNPSKKMKFANALPQPGEFKSSIDRFLHSMDSGEIDAAERENNANGLAVTPTESDLENVDTTEYDDILKFIRCYMFDGHTDAKIEKSLQLHVRSICNLKKTSYRGTERTAGRQRLQALRKTYGMLGIESIKEPDSGVKGKLALPAIKKEPKALEEIFIFEMDKKILTKGIPRGFVCNICNHPNNVAKCGKCAQHFHILCMTTDPAEVVKMHEQVDQKNFCCIECSITTVLQRKCFICKDEPTENNAEPKFRCMVSKCAQEYHLSCLRLFPQLRPVSASTIVCPYHACHTCVSSDPRGTASLGKLALAHCIKCPTSYHPSGECIPAGSVLLTTTQLICPKHTLEQIPLNVNWCFMCGKGGDLICCETCPFACHRVCLPFTPPDGKYFCEECESGRLPLYNEIVIAKFGSYRWWPALTVPPSEVPQNVLQLRQKTSDICVKFFGSHNMAWLNRKRMYLYQREDSESIGGATSKSSVDKKYRAAMAEASKIFKILQSRKLAGSSTNLATVKVAPAYIKIKANRYVPPLKPPSLNRQLDGVEDSVCRCHPDDDDPCGATSSCLNRAILMECSSKTCPAKERCSNQRFTKRIYPTLEVRYFAGKGFGLVALEDLKSGQFVIEYVGEVINRAEFERRVMMMQTAKEENYYFLNVEHEMTIDAGPKGNVSRFINHSCEPNCETQKWTIGETRVIGLFAIADISAGEELTFNYNLESLGNNKRVCLCGATKCSGYIGEKYRPSQKKEAVENVKSGRSLKNSKKKAKIRRAKMTTSTSNVSNNNNIQPFENDVVLIPGPEAVTVDLIDANANTSSQPLTLVQIKKEKEDNI